MKNKTLFIVLIILIVILIGWTFIFKKPQVQAPENPVTTPTTTTSSSKSSPASTQSIHGIAPKPDLSTVYLNGGQHPATTVLSVGQKLIVSLQASSDGGYQLDPVQYNSAIINLAKHTFTPPADAAKGVSGSSGTDTFEFVAIKSGTTGITITQSRPFQQGSTLPLFSNVVSVK